MNKYVNRNIGSESLTSATEGPWKGCAKTPIVPLTYKRANVEAGITAMAAAGNTLIAEGVAWGWRVLSPTEPFTKVEASASFPADTISTYNHPRWLKIMVVMTDGDNDISAGVDTLNGTTYTAYGRGKETLASNRFGTTSNSSIMPALDDAMTAACTKAKAEGIELYVTSFGSGVSAATKAKLRPAPPTRTTTSMPPPAPIWPPSSTTSARTCSTSRFMSANKADLALKQAAGSGPAVLLLR